MQSARGDKTSRYLFEKSVIAKRLYASTRIDLINSEDAKPVQAILDTNLIGVSKTLPVLNDTVRLPSSPTMVVYFFQSAFTSVSITSAMIFASPRNAGAPFQVTSTTSITRSSNA